MKKTKEELDQIKQELETITAKLKDLNEDELKEITGGLHEIQPQLAYDAIAKYNNSTYKFGEFTSSEGKFIIKDLEVENLDTETEGKQ
ncbi:MAG: hypothetical protein Q4E33_05170 [Erysipelotrichaceae bacterium]|nr:hypothetical protein [Erysipelotrichaceae bacterium]